VSPAASTAREVGLLGHAPRSGERERALHFSPARAEPEADDGGGLETPAVRLSWLGRTRATFRNSVWAPVALKLVGLALAMLALSGVGVASTLSGANGVQVPLAGMLGADLHSWWLATPSAEKPRANGGPGTLTATHALAAPAAPATSNAGTSNAGTSNASASNAGTVAPPLTDARPGTRPDARAPASAGMTEDGKVILNLASVEDLRHLPGVGPKRADAILALRARLGRFKQVNDLLRVKGIGVRGLKKIMPHVVLDAAKASA
jgi:competence protein ComEA